MTAGSTKSEAAWTAGDRGLLLGLFFVALLIRMLHLEQLQANDPFFFIPAVDGRLYHEWAQRIAAGDIVGEGVLILGPLYPYSMALIYTVFGPSLMALKLLQCLSGALVCVLIAVLARQYFDRVTALLAGALAVAYSMLIFYGGAVMVVNLQIPLILLGLIALAHAVQRPSVLGWWGAGLLVGASALARQTTLLFAPLIVLWLIFSFRDRLPLSRRARLAAAFALGLVVLIAPFTIRNYWVAEDWVLINSTGGANLYMGNNARSTGSWVPPSFPGYRVDNPLAMRAAFTAVADKETGRALKPSEVSSYWAGRALEYCLDAPIEWLRLEGRKLALFFNAREVWNNRSIDISREFSWILRLPLLTFGVVAPLGLLGIVLSLRRWRELFPLHALVLSYLGAAMIFFVLSRYRMPIVPILMIFAAHALVRLARAARAHDWRFVVLGLAGLALFAAAVNRDMGSENLYMAHFNVGNKYRALQRWERAIESYEKSLAIDPSFISSHNNLALAYEGAGRGEEAASIWEYVLAWSREHGDHLRIERALRHLRDLGVEEIEDGPSRR